MLPNTCQMKRPSNSIILASFGGGGNNRRDDRPRLGRTFKELPPAFHPTAVNPLHAYLAALAAVPPGRTMAVGGEEAPPDFRLSAMSYQIASLEKNLWEQVRKRGRGHTPYIYSR